MEGGRVAIGYSAGSGVVGRLFDVFRNSVLCTIGAEVSMERLTCPRSSNVVVG